MLKTCSRCGIVPVDHICPYKHYQNKDRSNQRDKFRSSKQWTKKSIEIRERDKYLCQICLRELYNTIDKYNTEDLEVHHIVALHEDYDKRLDNDNLITLCCYHHKLADAGLIPKQLLLDIVSQAPPTNNN